MFRINKVLGKKGIALPLVLLIAVVLLPLGMGSVYLLRQETKMTVKGKASLQADQLAEGAANRGLAELEKRIYRDLEINLSTHSYTSFQIRDYADNPMNFVQDCLWDSVAVPPGDQFAITGPNEASLNLQNNFETGKSTATIVITTTAPTDWDGETARFFFKYQILARASSRYDIESSTIVIDSASPAAYRANGEFEIRVERASFARYNLLCDGLQNDNWFANGYHFTGPVHFNDELNFVGDDTMNGNAGIFDGLVTSTANTANFFRGGHLNADFYDNGDGVPGAGDDRPVFNTGFLRGQANVLMPTDEPGIPQKQEQIAAASFGIGVSTTSLGNGVYVPNSGGNVTGGIYIKGDVNSLTMSLAGDGNKAVYTINHSDGNTYTIEVNMTSGRTKFDGNNYNGTLNGVIFTDGGGISALSGTVQENSQVTIATTGTITITDHIQYADNPLTNPAATNVLGILSWEDNIWIDTTVSGDLTIQAAIMTPEGIFEIEDFADGRIRGDLNLLGGVVGDEMGYHGVFNDAGVTTSGYNDMYVYDVRFLAGLAPPKFPITGDYKGNVLDFNRVPSWRYQVTGL